MSKLLEQLKQKVNEALKDNDENTKTLLRTVIGECQRTGKEITDIDVKKTIVKFANNLQENITICTKNNKDCSKFELELSLLQPYLPTTWNEQKLFDYIDSQPNLKQEIKDAKHEGQCVGKLNKILLDLNVSVDINIIKTIISSLRK